MQFGAEELRWWNARQEERRFMSYEVADMYIFEKWGEGKAQESHNRKLLLDGPKGGPLSYTYSCTYHTAKISRSCNSAIQLINM